MKLMNQHRGVAIARLCDLVERKIGGKDFTVGTVEGLSPDEIFEHCSVDNIVDTYLISNNIEDLYYMLKDLYWKKEFYSCYGLEMSEEDLKALSSHPSIDEMVEYCKNTIDRYIHNRQYTELYNLLSGKSWKDKSFDIDFPPVQKETMDKILDSLSKY